MQEHLPGLRHEQMLKAGVLCLWARLLHRTSLTCCGTAIPALLPGKFRAKNIQGRLPAPVPSLTATAAAQELWECTQREYQGFSCRKIIFPLCNCTEPCRSCGSGQESWTKQGHVPQSVPVKSPDSLFCYFILL